MKLNDKTGVNFITTFWNFTWVLVCLVFLFVIEKVKGEKTKKQNLKKFLPLAIIIFFAFAIMNYGKFTFHSKKSDFIFGFVDVAMVVCCEELLFRILFYEIFKDEKSNLSNSKIVLASSIYALFYFSKTIANPLNIGGFALQALFRLGFGAFLLCFLSQTKSRLAIIVTDFLSMYAPCFFYFVVAQRMLSNFMVILTYVLISVVILISDYFLLKNQKLKKEKANESYFKTE